MDGYDSQPEDCVEEPTTSDLLFDAIREGDTKKIADLKEISDFDINICNVTQKRALYFAIEAGNLLMVKTLIKHGANIDATSFCGTYSTFETPLVTAARLQQREIAKYLLEEGCVIDLYRNSHPGKSALQWAATHGDIGLGKLLLLKNVDLDYMGPHRHTALHYAVLKDHEDMAKWLLKQGAAISLNGDGRSALHIAAVRGNLPIVKELLLCGCDPSLKDSFDFTSFSLACLRGHLAIIKCLMAQSAVRTQKALDDGLLRASECGHLPTLRYLIDNGANVNAKNIIDETALSIAARGQYYSAKFLIENGALLTVVDKRGYTPLQQAILREQVDIASMLVQHGASTHACSSSTESPLQIACTISNAMLVKCLLDAGCDLQQESWFGADTVQDKIREIDYIRSIRFHRETTRQKEVWQWIADKVQRPPSLLEVTRIALRQHLLEVTGGRSVLKPVEKITLPTALKRYLSLDDNMYYTVSDDF